MATGKVNINSELVRKRWMLQGMIQASATSFWGPYTGSSESSIVRQQTNTTASGGHTVVFQSRGNYTAQPIQGRETAYGKGGDKQLFSDRLQVERYRIPIGNGDVFDSTEVANLAISQHSDSRKLLSDLFVRVKDQAIFDSLQGLQGEAPTHSFDITKFDYNALQDLATNLQTGTNYSTGDRRMPLAPYKMANGENCWILIIDPFMATELRKDSNYQAISYTGDMRGSQNRIFTGVIGKIGSLLIVESPVHYGTSTATDNGIILLNQVSTEIAGLRTRDSDGKWSGQPGFNHSSATRLSRGLLLGRGAIHMAFGKHPDYLFQESLDFKITSESAIEYWFGLKKAKLTAENEDYKDGKVAGVDVGVITVDFNITV